MDLHAMPPFHCPASKPDSRDDGEIADPRRLRRERTRWEGLDQATRFARFIVLDHGGRKRPVIHRGSRHLRSRLVSAKTNLLQISEGKGLRFLLRRCEIDGIVVDYQAHPFRIEAVSGGRVLVWYPDLVWVRRGERPRLVEVKPNISALEDPDYHEKMEIMIEVAHRIGWTMQVLYDDDIFGDVAVRADRWRNVNAIYSRRYLKPTADEERALSQLVAKEDAIAWSAARRILGAGDHARGEAVIEWAICKGRLTVDVDVAFKPWTVLTPLTVLAPAASIRI
jgi:hypothetical protein